MCAQSFSDALWRLAKNYCDFLRAQFVHWEIKTRIYPRKKPVFAHFSLSLSINYWHAHEARVIYASKAHMLRLPRLKCREKHLSPFWRNTSKIVISFSRKSSIENRKKMVFFSRSIISKIGSWPLWRRRRSPNFAKDRWSWLFFAIEPLFSCQK